jgi:adenylosuccinate lyase
VGRRRRNAQLGLRDSPYQSQAADRGPVAAWLAALAGVAGACEHFALQIRLGAQTGIGEFREGRPDAAAYRGSSSMAQKHNPTRSERVCGLAHVVRGLAAAHREASASWWDAHSLEHSSVERVVLPQVSELVGYLLGEVTEIARDLVIMNEVIAVNVPAVNTFAERSSRVAAGEDPTRVYEEIRHR